METIVDDAFGFGSVEACQSKLGIACAECKYIEACIGEPEPAVEEYIIGICMNCKNDFEVDIVQGENRILADYCPNCGGNIEWNE